MTSFLGQHIRSIHSRVAMTVLVLAVAGFCWPGDALAGTYPMYQCISGHPAVAPGWGVFSAQTNASTVLRNSCSSGGAIEDYVFSHGEPGAVEENGSNGSQVGLGVTVPGSAPDVSISSLSALVQISSVTGDDAFYGFTSAGQELPGAGEVRNGQGSVAVNDSWTLPSGARNFATYVNCTTDGSQTNCHFAESTHVPALSNITLTLIENAPPSLSSISGSLATAASQNAQVSGSQTFGFTAKDADSGVLSATLTLTPQGSGSNYTRTTSFSSQCTYESWNACPLAQNVSPFSVPTATLRDGTYAVTLTASDAAGNLASQSLGTITTHNAPTVSVAPAVTGTPAPGQSLNTTPASFTSEPEAGKVLTAAQWQRCDSQGNNCVAIAGASGASYNVVSADEGHMLRYQETVSNNAGSTVTHSTPFGPIQTSTTGSTGSGGSNGSNGSTSSTGSSGASGSNGANGSNGSSSVTVAVVSPGSNQGSILLGSSASWRLSLTVTPRRVRRGTTISLGGRVTTSPRPSNGKLVYLQARSVIRTWRRHGRSRRKVSVYGKWVTFQAFRAHSNGTFSSKYRFRLSGHHVYQFQAVAPAEGQYRNPSGSSNPVTVTES